MLADNGPTHRLRPADRVSKIVSGVSVGLELPTPLKVTLPSLSYSHAAAEQ
jgi:hypothetical protein